MKNLAIKLIQTDRSTTGLVMRLALGAMILPHGAQKLFGAFGGFGFEGTMQYFTQTMGIPVVFAFLAIVAEFFGGLGLLVGLGTRLAAFGVGAVMVVAALTSHAQFGFFMNWFGNQKGEGIEFHLLATALATALILEGGGRLSLDRILTQRK